MSNSNSFKLEKCLTKLANKAYVLKYGTRKSIIPGVVSNSTEKSYRKLNNVGKTLTLLLFCKPGNGRETSVSARYLL